MKWVLTLLFLFSLLSISYAQEEDTKRLKGRVMNADDKTAVAFATILITNKKKGAASNEAGFFDIPVELGDQIQITSIGYHPNMLIITQDYLDTEAVIPIFLLPKTYELDSVTVIQMTDDFYLKRRVWDTLKIQNPYLTSNPRDWGTVNTLPNTNGLAGVTITGFLNSFDKDLQQKRYLDRFEKAKRFKEEREAELAKRFNKEMVKEITNIDDRVIDEFMEFCDFRDGEILRSSEYEMVVKILAKYKQFLVR